MNLNNLPGLVDLTPVFAVFTVLAGSAYSASNILQWLRYLFLDDLIARMHDKQRTELLQTLLVVISFMMLLGLALIMHFSLSPNLLMTVFLGALGSAGGAHFSYQHNQKPAAQRYGVPEAPAPKVEPDPTDVPPTPPPTDEPASAALLDIAA